MTDLIVSLDIVGNVLITDLIVSFDIVGNVLITNLSLLALILWGMC